MFRIINNFISKKIYFSVEFMLMSFIDGHDGGIRLVAQVQGACAQDLLVYEGGLARRARALWTLVVDLVEAEPLTDTIDNTLKKKTLITDFKRLGEYH